MRAYPTPADPARQPNATTLPDALLLTSSPAMSTTPPQPVRRGTRLVRSTSRRWSDRPWSSPADYPCRVTAFQFQIDRPCPAASSLSDQPFLYVAMQINTSCSDRSSLQRIDTPSLDQSCLTDFPGRCATARPDSPAPVRSSPNDMSARVRPSPDDGTSLHIPSPSDRPCLRLAAALHSDHSVPSVALRPVTTMLLTSPRYTATVHVSAALYVPLRPSVADQADAARLTTSARTGPGRHDRTYQNEPFHSDHPAPIPSAPPDTPSPVCPQHSDTCVQSERSDLPFRSRSGRADVPLPRVSDRIMTT
jgi:hypothetical protein